MREWDVTFEFELEDVGFPLEDLADRLVGILSQSDPVASIVDGHLSLAVTVQASDVTAAMREAGAVAATGFETLGLVLASHAIVRSEVRTAASTDAAIATATYPPILGVAEVARLLAVSKQRVHELRASGRLPSPLAELRAGPVWPKSAIDKWLEGWERTPGRPKKVAVQGVTR